MLTNDEKAFIRAMITGAQILTIKEYVELCDETFLISKVDFDKLYNVKIESASSESFQTYYKDREFEIRLDDVHNFCGDYADEQNTR